MVSLPKPRQDNDSYQKKYQESSKRRIPFESFVPHFTECVFPVRAAVFHGEPDVEKYSKTKLQVPIQSLFLLFESKTHFCVAFRNFEFKTTNLGSKASAASSE